MKNKFITSTIILLIGGLITKVLGILIKISMARILSPNLLGLYMLILPTFILLINLGQFGFPIAISKLISEEKRNNKKLFFSLLPLISIINILLIILIIFIAPIISNHLLHNQEIKLSIIAMSLVIPFTTISSLCRSYFFGKQKMFPHVISNISENIIRLIIIIKLLPLILPLGPKYTICFLILINIISEIISTIILVFFLPKNITIKKSDLRPNKEYLHASLKISLPTTGSRLISTIGYFLEPMIITTILLAIGYNMNFITKEYGIITGYIIPLILLPSFFTLAISQALLPVISKHYSNNNLYQVKRKINQAIFLSLLIAIPITIIFEINPIFFLNTIYHTTEGSLYLRIFAPVCLLQYIQSPLTSCLDAMGKSKANLIITIIGTTIRITFLILFSYLHIGLWSLIIATSINIIITTLLEISYLKKYLSK